MYFGKAKSKLVRAGSYRAYGPDSEVQKQPYLLRLSWQRNMFKEGLIILVAFIANNFSTCFQLNNNYNSLF